MNRELPKVFAVPIIKDIKNNKEIYLSNEEPQRSSEPINRAEITKIFNSKNHVYKSKVKIKTRVEEKEVDIVGIKNNNLLTLEIKKV